MKIVINKCFGGFGLSYKAVMRYAEIKGIRLYAFVEKYDKNYNSLGYKPYIPEEDEKESLLIHYTTDKDGKMDNKACFYDGNLERTDPILVEVVKELKKEANGRCAELKIVEVPDDVNWEIEEYDGAESIHEKHRSW
jgi:hypothetical protein